MEHHIGEHLDEAAVGVENKPFIAGQFDHRLTGFIIESEVENGIHHTGHTGGGTGTNRNQQRMGSFSESFAGGLFQTLESGIDLRADCFKKFFLTDFTVQSARFGGDGESGRDRESERSHISKVGSFTAKKITHLGGTFGGSGSEEIDEFFVNTHTKHTSFLNFSVEKNIIY